MNFENLENVKSKIKTTYQKSSFMRKSRSIYVLPSQKIGEIKKCLMKNVTEFFVLFFFLFAGAFELAVIRMSRYLDVTQNCVLYGDTMLPQDAFYTTDTAEMKLVSCVFEIAGTFAALKLTDTELALFSAAVLLNPGKFTNISFHFQKFGYIAVKKVLNFSTSFHTIS